MAIAAERKTELISKFRAHESDTGSPEVQIARQPIESCISRAFKTHQKDHH